MRLPSASGLRVACDTEGSGLFPDDGARVSAVSCAWRNPDTSISSFATPFDQGTFGTQADPWAALPCGEKELPPSHARRLDRLERNAHPLIFSAPNRSIAAWSRLLDWLQRQDLVMHHKKYDCTMFFAGLRDQPGTGTNLMPRVVADTQLRQKVLDPQHTTSLKPTSERLHLGKEIGMQEGEELKEQAALQPWLGPKTDPRFDLIPWSVLSEYSRIDAVLTLLLDEHQVNNRLNDPEDPATVLAVRLIKRQEMLATALYHMELRGVGFDAEWCRAQDQILAAHEIEAKNRVPFRPTYPGAQKHFFGDPADGGLGLLPFNDKITQSGNPQVDEDVIQRLVNVGAEGASEFQALMELSSARAKWYKAYPDMTGPDGRLRTCYRQGTVVSGRLAVERWQSQAIPHDYQIPKCVQPIRYGFVSHPGWVMGEADVSQAEIRVATQVAKCGQMLKHIKAGTDSHAAAALLMFYPGMSLEEAQQDEKWAYNRGVPAKRCNLGILYGGGVGAIHAAILKFTGVDEDKDKISQWIRQWRQAFPPFVNALDGYAELAAKQGWVRLVDGSHRYFSDWEPVHKAFNQVIQGSVAIAVEAALVEFDQLYPDRLLLQIHDSLVWECPADEFDHLASEAKRILVKHFERLFRPVPFTADVKMFGRYAYSDKDLAA